MPPAPYRKRNRASLSCDRCRRLKRKCNRSNPCSCCLHNQSRCTWQGYSRQSATRPHPSRGTLTSGKNDLAGQSETASSFALEVQRLSATNSDPSPSASGLPDDSVPSLETVLSLSGFTNTVLTIWFRDLEWMYDILGETDFEREWKGSVDGVFEGYSSLRFGPILLAVCAIVCQLQSSDLEAALLAQIGGSICSSSLGRRCFEDASRRIDKEYAFEREEAPPLEHFQASLLLCAYCKNAGNRGQYRDTIYRDISRLQRRGLHQKTEHMSLAEEALANRIFWAYFTYDRLYFMIEGMPYCLTSHHADVWLQDDHGERIHVQDLCAGGSQPNPAFSTRPSPLLSLSVYVTSMAKLAAMVGRYSDRLSTLRHSLGRDPTVLPEEIASQAGADLSNVERELNDKMHSNQQMPSSETSSRTSTLHPSQRQVISMTIAKIKRDIATRLIQHLQSASLMSVSLHYQRIQSAGQLLQQALAVPTMIPLRQMSWAFFLFYTYEPILELLESLSQGESLITTAAQHLSFALSGRNLLVMIARESKTDLAQKLAGRICLHSADTLQRLSDLQQALIDRARDPGAIVEVQKTVDEYVKCFSTIPLDADPRTISSLPENRSDPASLASMQILEHLMSTIADPLLA